jgi:hypothetical protein
MSNRVAQLYKRSTLFHPSTFESIKDFPMDERTLLMVHSQRTRPINGLENLKPGTKFNLMEKDDLSPESNTRFLIKNIYGESLLAELFFSYQNIENVQNVIKYLVHKYTNEIIDKQSTTELLVIMRSIYLEYSEHPEIINDDMTNDQKQKLLLNYKKEVDRLNQIVFNNIVPKLVSQLQQYIDYLRDVSQQPKQMERSINDSIKGQKQYRSVTQLLTGNNL